MSWLTASTPVNTLEFIGVVAWATAASAAAVDRWWQCRRQHRPIGGEPVAWEDNEPPAPTMVADQARETA